MNMHCMTDNLNPLDGLRDRRDQGRFREARADGMDAGMQAQW